MINPTSFSPDCAEYAALVGTWLAIKKGGCDRVGIVLLKDGVQLRRQDNLKHICVWERERGEKRRGEFCDVPCYLSCLDPLSVFMTDKHSELKGHLKGLTTITLPFMCLHACIVCETQSKYISVFGASQRSELSVGIRTSFLFSLSPCLVLSISPYCNQRWVE